MVRCAVLVFVYAARTKQRNLSDFNYFSIVDRVAQDMNEVSRGEKKEISGEPATQTAPSTENAAAEPAKAAEAKPVDVKN